MKITDEMVGAAMLAYMKETAAEEFQVSGWLEPALRAALTAALAVQTQQGVEDLDARMKAAGMYTIAEMMGVTPLTKWKSNPAINTLDAFEEWLDRKVSEYLKMKAGYDLGDKTEDDELYEWVLAHAGVFSTIRDQFQVVRSALVDVPAVESEPVGYVNADFRKELSCYDAAELVPNDRSTENFKYIPLYAHPPLSLSNEGWMPIETAPKDGTVFLAVMAQAYSPKATLCKYSEGAFLSPSQGEKFVVPGWNQWWPTHWQPLPTPPLSTRKGSAGDGAATGTSGGDHG